MSEQNREDYYNKIVKKTIEKNIPWMVHWDITYQCNLKCVHCYAVTDKNREELHPDEMRAIIDQLAEAGVLFLVLSGGEILTRDDFFALAFYARKKGFALRLFTNGTLIDSDAANKIKDLEPLSVEMSLYGTSSFIHDGITMTPGSFEMTVNALNLLAAKKMRTIIKMVLMKHNVEEFRNLRKFAKEIHSGFIYDLTVISKDNGNRAPLFYRLNKEELIKFFLSNKDSFKLEPNQNPVNNLLCSVGQNNCFISPYGDVYPCIAIKKKAGNLRNKVFNEIWESEVFSKIRTIRTSELSECLNCEVANFCNRCPGLALSEDGDLLGCSTANLRVAKAIKSVVQMKN